MTAQVDLSTIPVSPEGNGNGIIEKASMEGKDVTVFHDKDNFNVKHPLQNKWTLWFTKPSTSKVCPLRAKLYLFASLQAWPKLTSP